MSRLHPTPASALEVGSGLGLRGPQLQGPLRSAPPESGTILKALSTASRSLRGCYLEELHVLPPARREPLRSLRILHSARALFVGLSDGVLRVPLERCTAYRGQR